MTMIEISVSGADVMIEVVKFTRPVVSLESIVFKPSKTPSVRLLKAMLTLFGRDSPSSRKEFSSCEM